MLSVKCWPFFIRPKCGLIRCSSFIKVYYKPRKTDGNIEDLKISKQFPVSANKKYTWYSFTFAEKLARSQLSQSGLNNSYNFISNRCTMYVQIKNTPSRDPFPICTICIIFFTKCHKSQYERPCAEQKKYQIRRLTNIYGTYIYLNCVS